LLKDSGLFKSIGLAVLMTVFCAAPSFAVYTNLDNLNLPGYETANKINFYMIQRAVGDISDKPFDNMLGTDQGMAATYGLSFRITDWTDLSIFRSNLNQEFFVANKIKFFDGFSFLWGIASKTSSLITRDKNNYVVQLILCEEILKDKLTLTFVPTYSNYLADRPSFAIGMGGRVTVAEKVGYFENIEFLGEYTPAFGGYALSNPELGVGFKFKTLSQILTLMVTNVLYAFPNGYILGNNDGLFHFGFNLACEI